MNLTFAPEITNVATSAISKAINLAISDEFMFGEIGAKIDSLTLPPTTL